MEEILHTQPRDKYLADACFAFAFIFMIPTIIVLTQLIKQNVYLSINGKIYPILVPCIVYLCVTILFNINLIWCQTKNHETIVMDREKIQLKAGDKTVRQIAWKDVLEVGILSANPWSMGERTAFYYQVYLSSELLDDSERAATRSGLLYRKERTPAIYFTCQDASFLRPLLPDFEPWLSFACDSTKIMKYQRNLPEDQVCIYMPKYRCDDGEFQRVTEVQFLSATRFRELYHPLRKWDRIFGFLVWAEFAATILAVFWALL